MSKLSEKLIVVGMRHIPGSQCYLSSLKGIKEVNVVLKSESNPQATGGIAYAVYHRDYKLGYVREADLPYLKRELYFEDSSRETYRSTSAYNLVQISENYLVLKLRSDCQVKLDNLPIADMTTILPGQKNLEVNPCKEIYLKDQVIKSNQNIQIKREETMFDKIVANNKAVAVNAAYMEAGRIANNQVTKLVAAKAPLMIKGYVDTPVGKVVLANLTAMVVDQFRPTDVKLKKVSVAMMTEAYQELIKTIDIEGMLNELTSSEGIKAALAAVSSDEPLSKA